MDKRSIIGILLIFAILVVFSIINQPSKEEIEEAKRKSDSIAQVELEKATRARLEEEAKKNLETKVEEVKTDTIAQEIVLQERENRLGSFGKTSIGEEEFYTVETNLYKIVFTNKGGRVNSVELKEYQTHDSLPLILFDGPETLFSLNFFSGNRIIQTGQLYFTTNLAEHTTIGGPKVRKGDEGKEKKNIDNPGESKVISFKLEPEPGKFIEYVYTIKHNSYMVGFDLNMQGMNDQIASNISNLNLTWSYDLPRQERISKWGEDRYTDLNYKFYDGDIEKISQGKSKREDLPTKTHWIGFKQLFFNSTIIADDNFPSGAVVESKTFEDNPDYLANFYADIPIPYNGSSKENFGMAFYFGPNHYQTLKQYDIGLERLVYLGYAIVRPVNRYIIIPVFNFLRKYLDNFGLIILLLTIFIKTLVFPFTYKSYISQAKMRALKPEVDELNAKFGADKAMEKQQATMALYRKAGVSPMGGCLPMLLQMPILFAMFFFFPTSIELRHESFLWAQDLSTYDSVLKLPFNIPIYGDHVSLFCLLMTISTIISTRLNPQTASSASMPGMKSMMYIMPLMFLFILNSYPSGLSYYYLLANLFTIGQTYLVRRFVDEEKIRAQLLINKKKPQKKSGFQARLEEMAKQRAGQQPKKKKK